MKVQPKVSVIIPIYNNETYLREGLDSILAQTVKELEIICVDDGSTDSSCSILEEYAQKDARIKTIRQKNQGAGAARNNGFLHATGEYVYYFDSDDLCDKGLLAKTVSIADKKNADIVCFNFESFDAEGHRDIRKGIHFEWLPSDVTVFNYRTCPNRILSVMNPTPWNKLYRRTFIQKNNLRYEEITSTNDITFAAVSAATAERIVAVSDVLYRYRKGHGNTISSTKSKNLKNIVAAVESTARQVRQLPYYDKIACSLKKFEVDNYVFALRHYIADSKAPEVKEFYTFVHNRFCAEEYAALTEQDCGYKELYDAFRVVRANDYETLDANFRRKLIVSMTTYPARIADIHYVLDTIFDQTRKADEVILWLAEEQFPNKDLDLPHSVMKFVEKNKIQIRWCEDLKPHKKYFYALQEYHDDLIVTIDDDLLYHPQLLENLYVSYLIHPDAISAARAHLITRDEEDNVLPYKYWVKEYDGCIDEPSMQLLCTGGAGSLYPAYLFGPELFDKQAIMDCCLFADDIWLKVLELVAGIPVVIAERYQGLKYVPGSQTNRLCDMNVEQDQNDIQFIRSVEWAEKNFGKGCIKDKLMHSEIGVNLMKMEVVCQYYADERKRLLEKLKNAYLRTGKTDNTASKSVGIMLRKTAKRIMPKRVKIFVKKMLLRVPHKVKARVKRAIRW